MAGSFDALWGALVPTAIGMATGGGVGAAIWKAAEVIDDRRDSPFRRACARVVDVLESDARTAATLQAIWDRVPPGRRFQSPVTATAAACGVVGAGFLLFMIVWSRGSWPPIARLGGDALIFLGLALAMAPVVSHIAARIVNRIAKATRGLDWRASIAIMFVAVALWVINCLALLAAYWLVRLDVVDLYSGAIGEFLEALWINFTQALEWPAHFDFVRDTLWFGVAFYAVAVWLVIPAILLAITSLRLLWRLLLRIAVFFLGKSSSHVLIEERPVQSLSILLIAALLFTLTAVGFSLGYDLPVDVE